MCLIAVAHECHLAYRLVVVANRDEFLARSTLPLHAWTDPTGMIAGVDTAETPHGTWLAWHPRGRWAAVTNVREPQRPIRGTVSRGTLPVAALAAPSPAVFARDLERTCADNPRRFSGFNLLTGDGDSLWWFSNRASGPQPLAAGVHGLSNGKLDEQWPKVHGLCRELRGLLANDVRGTASAELYRGLLLDRSVAADAELPSTGLILDHERALSARFIELPGYGTRSSAVLRWWRDGRWQFDEWTHGAGGPWHAQAAGHVGADLLSAA